MAPHIFGRPAEHDDGCLDDKILKDLKIQEGRVLILFFEVGIDLLNYVLNLFHGDIFVEIVILEQLPSIR